MRSANSIAELTQQPFLEGLFGAIGWVRAYAVTTAGCSDARFFRVDIGLQDGGMQRCFLKICDSGTDWLAARTEDIGREGLLLADEASDDLWDIFACPYLAVANEDGRYGLLMYDLADELWPLEFNIIPWDARLLRDMAHMHALYWERPELCRMEFLMNTADYFRILGPTGPDGFTRPSTSTILPMLREGWQKAAKLLPSRLYHWLCKPPAELAAHWTDCPRTLIHGDFRPLNLGYCEGSDRLYPLDWASAGFAPCTVDLYWYLSTTSYLRADVQLAVNYYRCCLEQALGEPLPQVLWDRMQALGVATACAMEMWEKALDFEQDPRDFRWWKEQLSAVVGKVEHSRLQAARDFFLRRKR